MQELQAQILELSVAERLQLIRFIAASIPTDDTAFVPSQWLEEAQTRNVAFTASKHAGYSWEEVKKQVYGEEE